MVPLASTVLPEHAVDQDTVGPLPSHLVMKQEPPIYSLKHNSRKKVLVPTPLQVHEPAQTAFHRKKHRLIIGLQQSRGDRAPRPSLPFEGSSSSENVSGVVDGSSYGTNCVRQAQLHPECTLSSMNTPPSVNKLATLKTKTVPHDCKARKSLFQSNEAKGKATELEMKLLENTTYS